jgi:prepilin-type N-terminal cleavage/methylation domain-containing protein
MKRSALSAQYLAPQAFTLLELLVVLGLIAALSFVLLGSLAGGGKSVALQSGQTLVANLITAARIRAVATGNQTRILVHHDTASPLAAGRYLRQLAMEELRAGAWVTLQSAALPDGIYVLPHQNRTPANLLPGGVNWIKADGTRLHSSCLFRAPIQQVVDSATAENWVEIAFSSQGTTATSGQLVLATGRLLPPGAFGPGESPSALDSQETVRGLSVSGYGLAVLINERGSF